MNSESQQKIPTIVPNLFLELSPGEALTTYLHAGEEFIIEDVDGTQVGDLVVFFADDHTERFSPGNTRKLNRNYLLSEGSILYSTKCRPMMSIVEDTAGRNDMLFSSCSPYDYPLRFGVSDHVSCLGALRNVLTPLGIPEYLIPDPFNIFQNTALDLGTGAMETISPISVPGSRMRLKAEGDCLVALSACPQDLNLCNGGTPTSLRVMTTGDKATVGPHGRSDQN